MTDRGPHSSLKPTEAILQVSPTSGANYRGNSNVLLAIIAIVGSLVTCGWYMQSQIAILRSEAAERHASIKAEIAELRLELRYSRLTAVPKPAQ
jgi:hypothetical protein